MKKLFTLLACGAILSAQAQVVLYSEDFEGSSHTFTLNTTDQSSTASGYNQWVVNNSYNGGSYTDNNCTSFPVTISATTSQPAGITNAPNSKYMHIVCVDAMNQGVSNANFLASDGGAFCVGDQNYFAKMTSDISTTGTNSVSISFWWLCRGSSASYGELYYSTNGGTTWFLQQSNMQNQATWTQATITNALWDNQATLRFAFRFVNAFTFSAQDPPMCIDDIEITGVNPSLNTITTGTLTNNTICAGLTLQVPYLAAGTYNAGNIFSAELSDASGNFTAPTVIGTLSSTTSGNINATIPAGTVSGTGYLVRVTSSNPAITGSVSPTTLTIHALPNATATSNSPVCAGDPLTLISGGGTVYSWSGPSSYNSTTQNPTINPSATGNSGTYTVAVTDANGCTQTATTTVVVNNCAGVEDEELSQVSIYPNPAQDVFSLQLPPGLTGKAEVTIYNLLGEKIQTLVPSAATTYLQASALGMAPGTYLIVIRKEDKEITRRIVIR